jgi:hypothetical protein
VKYNFSMVRVRKNVMAYCHIFSGTLERLEIVFNQGGFPSVCE